MRLCNRQPALLHAQVPALLSAPQAVWALRSDDTGVTHASGSLVVSTVLDGLSW